MIFMCTELKKQGYGGYCWAARGVNSEGSEIVEIPKMNSKC